MLTRKDQGASGLLRFALKTELLQGFRIYIRAIER